MRRRKPSISRRISAKFILHRCTRIGHNFPAGFFDACKLVAKVLLDDLGTTLPLLGVTEYAPRLLAGVPHILEHGLNFEGLRPRHFFGVIDDDRVKPEPAGDGQGIGAARQADAELESRAEVLDIEFNGCVANAGGIVGIQFEVAVMGCGECCNAPIAQVFKECGRECRAFVGIGSGSQFIKQDEALGVGLFQDVDDVGHVTGECAQVLFDGLFVAYVGVDTFEDRQDTAFVYWDHHARLGHQGKKADGLKGDSFAAGVWARNHKYVTVVVEINVDGYDGVRVKHGVAGLAKVQNGTRMLDGTLFFSLFVDTGEDFGAFLLEGTILGAVASISIAYLAFAKVKSSCDRICTLRLM